MVIRGKTLRGAGFAALAIAGAVALPASAWAVAENWQIYFSESASPIMDSIRDFNYWIQILIGLIVLLVLVLLAWVLVRYNAKANPVPSRTSHNSFIEVIWTIGPVLILVGIAIPSFALLFAQYDPARAIPDYDPATAVTVKATGLQWSWKYEYPDLGLVEDQGTAIYSNPLPKEALAEGQVRLLSVDYPFVVPVDTVIRLQATADPTGVIHAVALPAFGVKIDAVPGRIHEMWFLAEREGIYYGQCSELCGTGHYNMPLEVRVVSPEVFQQWAETMVSDPDGANALLAAAEEARKANLAVAAR
jgi:cytochrome c oxidase subunit 2